MQPTKKNKPRRIDLTNVLSMVDKVFSDVLVSKSWIKDDDIASIGSINFKAEPYAEESYVEVNIKVFQ